MKKYFSLFCLILLSLPVFSQIRYFSPDTAVFIREFEKYMGDASNTETKETTRKFRRIWNDNQYSFDEMSNIIQNMNRLIIMGNTEPDNQFFKYMRMLVFSRKEMSEERFNTWHRGFQYVLMNDYEKYTDYLDFSYQFFMEGCLVLDDTRRWKASSNDFKFTFNRQPILTFDKTNLYCYTEGDTMIIESTSGTYTPYNRQWQGKEGTVTWGRAGYDPKSIYAKLSKYNINLKKAEYKVDTVTYYNLQFFGRPLKGSFEDRVGIAAPDDNFTFPRFLSFEKTITIKNLVKEVDLQGGFWHKGSKIMANGNDSQQTQVIFKYKGRKQAVAKANSFVITPTRLVSDKAEISYYMYDSTGKADSIYHPQVILNFLFIDRSLSAVRGKEGITQTPFMDSYHKMEIMADLLNWQMDVPLYELKMINTDAPAIFESGSFYRENRYESVQGMLGYNPVEKLRYFCIERSKQKIEKPGEFTLDEYLLYLQNREEYAMPQILMLNDRGFIIYNQTKKTIQVQKKTFDYYNNHKGLSDFDVIRLESIIKLRPNGTINLINNDLQIEGCPGIQFSDSQSVYTIATQQKMTVKRNRDMIFGGRVHAGRFDFFGKDFYFNYNGFNIKMDNVDSMRFHAPSRDDPQKYVLVQTVLQNIYGTLYIDKENNKSGKKDYPEYPRFVSDRGAMVYYDKPEIYNGIYNRNEFFFKTDPFEINSLDKFKLEDIKLSGLFSSGGILPDIRDTLTVQRDYSLGFIRPTPPDGYAMYSGKGKMSGGISLSNEGLWGNGKVEYLSSVGNSQKFIMFLDSTNGDFEDYDISRTDQVPDVRGVNVWLHWEPKNDKMFVSSKVTPLEMMRGKSDLYGTTILEPSGLGGYGDLRFDKSKLFSEDFRFHPMSVNAEKSDFELYAVKDTTQLAFVSKNIKSFIDFEKRFGDFKANDLGANTLFPFNLYKTNMNDYHWEIDKQELEFRIPSVYAPEDIYFESTKREQDGLKFQAGKARFDLKTNLLDITEVPYIAVCDAYIYPDKGHVQIEVDAVMRELKNSKMECDSVSKFHNIYNASIKVLGKFRLDGNGYYDYIQRGNKQIMYFDQIGDNRRGRILCISHIADSLKFLLGTHFQFKGEAKLHSSNPMLEFDGFMKPIHSLPIRTDYYRHTQFMNPDSTILTFSHPLNESKVEMYAGIVLALDSPHIYPVFSGRKKLYADPEILSVNGSMYYDELYQQFVIADSAKLFKKSPIGPMMTINEDKKLIFGEGKMNLGLNTKDFVISAAGEVNISLGDTLTTIFELLATFDFPFPKSALGLMQDSIIQFTERAKNINYFGKAVRRNIHEYLQDPKRVEKFMNRLNDDGKFTIEDEFEKMFTFTNLKLEWHTRTKMYWAMGEANLVNIGKKYVGKKVNLWLSIERKKSGDVINMLISHPKKGWYFFTFQKGVLGALSTDKWFNEAVDKDGDRMKKINIRIRKATARQVGQFLRNMESW